VNAKNLTVRQNKRSCPPWAAPHAKNPALPLARPAGFEPATGGLEVRPSLRAGVRPSLWLLELCGLPKPNCRQICSSLRAGGRGRLATALVYGWCRGWCSRSTPRVRRLETTGKRSSPRVLLWFKIILPTGGDSFVCRCCVHPAPQHVDSGASAHRPPEAILACPKRDPCENLDANFREHTFRNCLEILRHGLTASPSDESWLRRRTLPR
jgi:hypothetical protein